MARVIQIIETFDTRGTGVPENPMRQIRQYFDFEGNLLWEEKDQWKKESRFD